MLSVPFAPSLGGIETVVQLLGYAFCQRGHSVQIVTRQSFGQPDAYPFAVMRLPSAKRLLRAFKQSDCAMIHGPTVSLGWPSIFHSQKSYVIHHMVRTEPLRARERVAFARVRHFAVSQAVASSVPFESRVVFNPYNDAVFFESASARKTGDYLFAGRLIKAKGAHILLDAFARIHKANGTATLTIVGDGEEAQPLREQARVLAVQDAVCFTGELSGTALAEQMRKHRIIVIPSLAAEGFGLVALEGIACGCVAVGFDSGGLREAIGPCGITVAEKTAPALAQALSELLESLPSSSGYRASAAVHLQKYRPTVVAERYLRLLNLTN
jgi:glycosyltransferase involved in cell wall biosynthesis